MDSDFEKTQQNNCTLYIHKRHVNEGLAQGLLAGEEKLRERYVLNAIPSSESTHIDKFNVSVDDAEKEIYLKQYHRGPALRFIKSIFLGSRARRAFEAALMLAKNGFDTPAVVAMGEYKDGLFHRKSFLATFAVESSKTIYRFIPENSKILDEEQLRSWRQMIRALGQTIGRMHAKGIFHGDLRLGNVLARREGNSWRFFFLDNERTKKYNSLPFKLRVKNLVQANMVRDGNISNTDRMRFFREYCAENKIGKRQSKALAEKVLKRTNRRLNKERMVRRKQRKCLRTNTRYLRVKTGKYLAMFNRSFCGWVEPIDFIEQIDTLMNKGQIFKNDKTSYVSRLMWNGKDIVIKRYNHRGLFHLLRHTIMGSRAKQSWLYGYRLMMLGIPTPKPVAYIELRKGPLVWKSYLITEYVDGQNLHYFLRDKAIGQERRFVVVRQILEMIENLHKNKITHRDLKPTNILVTADGPALTDLDAITVHKLNWVCRWKGLKYIERFKQKVSNSD
ncbi:MAG: lipopolysaccharide kinase InaA family protein [Sedimentisphaerales bacterium]